MKIAIRLAAALLAVSALPGCGGGGGGEPAPAPTLSQSQRVFEDNTLAANGGSWLLELPFSVFNGVITSGPVAAAKIELPSSPLGVSAGVQATYTPAVDLVASLPTPANRNEANANVGTAFIDGGQIRFFRIAAPATYKYDGADIIGETRAPGGEIGALVRYSSYEKVALAGKFADAPAELRNVLGSVAGRVHADVSFAAGSAYYKRVGVRVGEHLVINDADNNFDTDPGAATPLAAGTIEQYAAAHATLLDLSRGTIRTVKGVRCWVNNGTTPNGPSAGQITFTITPAFSAFCEVGANLYGATLQSDGAVVGTGYPTGLLAPNSIAVLPFQVRFNKAAVDSIQAMVQ